MEVEKVVEVGGGVENEKGGGLIDSVFRNFVVIKKKQMNN